MNKKPIVLDVAIKRQPNDLTCGPTCLHAVYDFFGEDFSLSAIIREVKMLKSGGTLAVNLGLHALKKGYSATIHTFNLQIFDPSWFDKPDTDLIPLLREQFIYKGGRKLQFATETYIRFLELGGEIKYQDLSPSLLNEYLSQSLPVLTGLSATYLYNSPREIPENSAYDSIKGEPAGHFVVLNGIDLKKNIVFVADPLHDNPLESQYYSVDVQRLIHAILLGIVTYDANILVINPKD